MNFEKLPSGTWRVQVKMNGRRWSGSAPSKQEARILGLAKEQEFALGSAKVKSLATLGDLLDEHVADFGYSEAKRYKNERLVAALGDLDPSPLGWLVRDVDGEAASRLMRTLKSLGWIDSRRRSLHGLLSSAWVRAIEHGWAKSNVWKGVARPTDPTPKIVKPSDEQVAALFGAMSGTLGVLVRLAASTGMRLGETCGVQWGDIDFERGKLHLARAVAHVTGKGLVVIDGSAMQNGRVIKNHERTITLDSATVAMLKAHRVEQVELALAAGLPSPVWAFSDDAGVTPWLPSFASYEYGKVARSVGVSAPIKSLRHYMATTWLTAGVPLLVVSGRLGHSKGTTTLAKYADYVVDSDADYVERMAAKLAG